MAISTNPQWNYGTILTPDTMNNIENALDQMTMGAIDKKTEFNGNQIIEYFGKKIILGNGEEYQNKKITDFLENGNIKETYLLYFEPGINNNIDYISKTYTKLTIFNSDGSISETVTEGRT